MYTEIGCCHRRTCSYVHCTIAWWYDRYTHASNDVQLGGKLLTSSFKPDIFITRTRTRCKTPILLCVVRKHILWSAANLRDLRSQNIRGTSQLWRHFVITASIGSDIVYAPEGNSSSIEPYEFDPKKTTKRIVYTREHQSIKWVSYMLFSQRKKAKFAI